MRNNPERADAIRERIAALRRVQILAVDSDTDEGTDQARH